MNTATKTVESNFDSLPVGDNQIILTTDAEGSVIPHLMRSITAIHVVTPQTLDGEISIDNEKGPVVLKYHCTIIPLAKPWEQFHQQVPTELKIRIQIIAEDKVRALAMNHPPSNQKRWEPFDFDLIYQEIPMQIMVANTTR